MEVRKRKRKRKIPEKKLMEKKKEIKAKRKREVHQCLILLSHFFPLLLRFPPL